MVALRIAVLWLGLIAPASVPGGEVVSDALEVLVEPDDSGYASGELKRGDRVAIVPGAGPGWLAIAPPSDAFDWVDASAIRAGPDGQGEVVAARASVRSGGVGARMPGPPRAPLAKGTVIRLLDRPSLTLGEGPKARSWRAISPPTGEVRYVRADGVRLDPSPMASTSTHSPKVADAQVRPVRRRPAGDANEAIRKFEEALERSRRLDGEAARIKQKLAETRTIGERAYDAKGLLQASSRQFEGQRVHALIGPEGRPIAYLTIPPGIPATRFLARKVGVRGDVHFNEALGNRLITVRDLDPLDRPR